MEEVKNKSDKILVAEDDEVSNPIILWLLSQKGFSKISQPKNGNVALSKLYLNQVSIIISDGRMSDIDGLDFHRRAKKGRSTNGLLFLIVTAESERGQVA